MNKCFFFIVTMIFSLNTSVNAQSIEEGRKMMNYERYKAAAQIFQNLLTKDPNNEEAIYLMGQTMILGDEVTAKDIEDAKAYYQSKLSIPNNNLIVVGVGHTELLQGKAGDARNHFEAAISMTQGKNIAVLNAIGFANVDAEGKGGDPGYAIDKLTLATQQKKFNDPMVWVNLGDAYTLKMNGADAIQSYESAIAKDPKCAKAFYKIGRIYQSQGSGQESLFLDFYNKAIAADPAFPLVYKTLYSYYVKTNTALASEYMDKWFNAVNHEDPRECYYRSSLKYSMKLYTEAIKTAESCVQSGSTKIYPGLYGILAYANKEFGDTAKSIENFRTYFSKQLPEKITSSDYMEFARLLLKIPGSDLEAGQYVDKAALIEKMPKSKQEGFELMAVFYEKNKQHANAAIWYRKLLNNLARPTNVNLYNLGYNFYKAAAYDSALSVFKTYTEVYPEELFGQSWAARSAAAIDTSATLGLAVPYFQKVVELGDKEADKTKVKDKYLLACQYLMNYFFYEKKDQVNAILYADKAVVLDPANANLTTIRDYMSKNDPNKVSKPDQKSKSTGKP